MITTENVIRELKTVYDPEIPVNIYDLGLIYNIGIEGSLVKIKMTLTTATCPAAAFMPEEIKAAVERISGVINVQVEVVFEPRWTRDKMSAEARQAMGF